MEFDTAQVSQWIELVVDLSLEYGPPLLLAAILLFVGFKAANKLETIIAKALQHTGVEESLIPFLSSMAGIGLKILLFLAVAGIVGIDTASFVAVLAAASFAVGLALQGSLSNFAAGILILVFRPYKAGDWIELEEKFGQVEGIQIFNTIIVTPGNKTLIIPNAHIVDNIVTNHSEKGYVRLDLQVAIPYGEDFPRIQEIIMDVLRNTSGVHEEPTPEVGIDTFDSHSVVVAVRPYVNADDYWKVTFAVHQNIKAAFHTNKVQVAYSEGVELGPIGK